MFSLRARGVIELATSRRNILRSGGIYIHGETCGRGSDSDILRNCTNSRFEELCRGLRSVSAGPAPTKSGQFGRRVVSVQSSKYLLAIVLTGALGPMPVRMFGQAAAAPASNAPQKNWKDRAEYDPYVAIGQDQNPKTRLEKVQQWEKAYPMTEWIKERRKLFLTTEAAVNDGKAAMEIAKQILADDPKDFTALYYTMLFTQGLYGQSQSPDVLEQGEKAA